MNKKEVLEMATTNYNLKEKKQAGLATGILAAFCHSCRICPYAAQRPDSSFEKLMRWHRKWCPAWAAHTKVYGVKDLI